MNINTINFPLCFNGRKPITPVYQLPINNQRHHPASHSQNINPSIENTNGNAPFLPSVSTASGSSNVKPRPYQLNDFANNHLFIAKRKLARVFHEQPTRNVQSTNDLLHLFDQQGPKRKIRNTRKHKGQESTTGKTSSVESDIHLSVVNLNISPAYPPIRNRDQLSTGLIRPFELWSGVKTYYST